MKLNTYLFNNNKNWKKVQEVKNSKLQRVCICLAVCVGHAQKRGS